MSLQSEQDNFIFVFGRQGAKLGSRPHLVVPHGPMSLDCVLTTVNEPAGVWGDYPQFDLAGGNDSFGHGFEKQFRMWVQPLNQQELRRIGGYSKLGQFTCVLPQSVPDSILSKLRTAIGDDSSAYFENTWPTLVECLGPLTWFFAPLGDEIPLAVFCAVDDHIVRSVVRKFEIAGVETTRIESSSNGETWRFGANLRKLCGIDREATVATTSGHVVELDHATPEEDESFRRSVVEHADSLHLNDGMWSITVTNNDALVQCCRLADQSTKYIRFTTCLEVSDEGLKKMPVVQKLVSMKITHPVNAAGIDELARQPNLEELCIVDIRLNNEAMESLKYFVSFAALNTLEFDLSELSTATISRLVAKRNLETVIVDGITIKGKGIMS